jgi:S1-C subfamily serine protease
LNRDLHRSSRACPCAAILALGLLAWPASAQVPGEDAFRAAGDWTVQVRTAVAEPFIEDEQGSWLGAGLLVDAGRGWVLTNAHVAGHSYGRVSLAFKDGLAIPARRLYVDPHLDLAVLAFDPRRLRAAVGTPQLACDGIPPVGHPVGAFGHPWGFRYTGTRGITSAVTTRLGANMLQTDAPINEGNSGGPLISLETGQVVGINTAKIKDESVEGLSFAVPMPYACTVLELLRQGRDPSPPARLVDFAHDENDERTMIVARSRLPSGTLDLRVGDEILGALEPPRLLGTETDLVDALRGRLDAVGLRVRREGRETELRGSWPAAPRLIERRGLWIDGALFGEAERVTGGLVAGGPVLMVHHVDPGSEAESAGLLPFDLLVTADRRAAESLASLQQSARLAARERRPLELMLLRIGAENSDELFLHVRRLLPAEQMRDLGP